MIDNCRIYKHTVCNILSQFPEKCGALPQNVEDNRKIAMKMRKTPVEKAVEIVNNYLHTKQLHMMLP